MAAAGAMPAAASGQRRHLGVRGDVLALAGLTLSALHALGPGPWTSWPFWKDYLALPLLGIAMIGAALGLVLLGQLARASFDAAGALRELLAVERAKAEYLNSQGQR